jgi:hypothetical protein
MGTAIWGPSFWYVIHIVADSAPDILSENQQILYREFYQKLIEVLPCPICSIHARDHIKKHPPVVSSRIELLKWTIRFHNEVNQQLGKRIFTEQEGLEEIQRWIRSVEAGDLIVKPPEIMDSILRSPILWTIVGILIGFILMKVFQRKS